MKINVKGIKLGLSLFSLLLIVTSCKYEIDWDNSIKGSGKIITENRNLRDFDKVIVSRGLECKVHQSENFKVLVEADDNLVKGIKTTIDNGTLVITSDYGNYINVGSKKVIVHAPKFLQLETTSGASLITKNILLGNTISLKSSSGSTLTATVEFDQVTLESSSGSELNVRGKSLKTFTDSSSGSSINAEELMSNDIFAQSSSGSNTKIHPIVSLDAKASSGSSIYYKSNPKTVNKEESSGGSISN